MALEFVSCYATSSPTTFAHGIGSREFTLCCWIYPFDARSDVQRGIFGCNFGDVAFYTTASSPSIKLYALISSAGGACGDTLKNRCWQHLIFTRVNGRIFTYIDGVRGSISVACTASFPDGITQLGSFGATTNSNHILREMGLFKSACSQDMAIRCARRREPACRVIPNCRGWWPMQGSTVAECLKDLGPKSVAYAASGTPVVRADGSGYPARPGAMASRSQRRRVGAAAASGASQQLLLMGVG